MGAMINISYDSHKVSSEEATQLATSLQLLAREVMGEKDVFVYADAKPITIGADPIEVFIQVNEQKLTNPAGLMDEVAGKLNIWKEQSNFQHLINLNVIPVIWHSKIGI